MVKLVATAPLLSAPLKMPKLEDRFFKEEAFIGGKYFLYENDAEKILMLTRAMAAIFTLALAVIVFLGTKEMFGTGAAFITLTLLAFDPNLLAHGAVVTTDVALSCFMFASIYAYYRYVKAPTPWRLIVVALATGLALAAKHTGALVFPILLLLAIVEAIRCWTTTKSFPGKQSLKLLGSLVVITVISLTVLWAFYGFRYAARPDGLQLNPPLVDYVTGLKPHEIWAISTMARWHFLPESYLYGLGRSTDGKLLHQLCVRKNLCSRSLVLFPGCLSDQIDGRIPGSPVVDGWCNCNSPSESLARDPVPNCSAGLLPGSRLHCRNEHRGPPHPAGLRISVSSDRRCGSNADSTQS